jgi:hypothetical protein
MVARAIQTLPAIAAPTKNGMRQPQASRLSWLIRLTVRADTATASSPPTSLDAEAIDATNPRFKGRAPSIR